MASLLLLFAPPLFLPPAPVLLMLLLLLCMLPALLLCGLLSVACICCVSFMVVVHGVDDDDVLEVVGNRVSFSLGWIATVAVVIQFIGECANFSLALPLLDVMDDFLGLRGKEVEFSLATMSE